MSAAALWEQLAAAGLVTGEMPADTSSPTPWYVRVMLCVAGFIAALFLMAFVGAALMFVVESAIASTIAGAVLIGAAVAIFRNAPRSDFATTFALALSMLGQVFVVWVLVSALKLKPPEVATAILVLEAALALAMPSFVHRVLSALAASIALPFALLPLGLTFIAPGLLACAFVWLWLNECRLATRQSITVPIAYGLTLAYVQMEAVPLLGLHAKRGLGLAEAGLVVAPWLAEALAVGALVATVVVLLDRAGWQLHERRTLMAAGSVLAIGAASFLAPGLAGSLAIAVLGFANANRVLLGLGVVSMLFYASTYYYLLDITLLAKSGVLIATGVTLLAARWILMRFVLTDEGPSA